MCRRRRKKIKTSSLSVFFSIFFFALSLSLPLFSSSTSDAREEKTRAAEGGTWFPRDLLPPFFKPFLFLRCLTAMERRRNGARPLLRLPSLPYVVLLLFILATTTTLTPSATAAWRPTPLRASSPTISLSSSGSLSIKLRYKTWDGYFLDVVELPAGQREREREFDLVCFYFFSYFGQAQFFFLFLGENKNYFSLSQRHPFSLLTSTKNNKIQERASPMRWAVRGSSRAL